MGIAVTCTNCGGRYQAADPLAGKKVKCLGCATILDVPIPFDEPEPDSDSLPRIDEEYLPVRSAPPPAEMLAGGPAGRRKPTARKTQPKTYHLSTGKGFAIVWFVAMAVAAVVLAFLMGARWLTGIGLGIALVSGFGFSLFRTRFLSEEYRSRGMLYTTIGSLVGVAVMLLAEGFPSERNRKPPGTFETVYTPEDAARKSAAPREPSLEPSREPSPAQRPGPREQPPKPQIKPTMLTPREVAWSVSGKPQPPSVPRQQPAGRPGLRRPAGNVRRVVVLDDAHRGQWFYWFVDPQSAGIRQRPGLPRVLDCDRSGTMTSHHLQLEFDAELRDVWYEPVRFKFLFVDGPAVLVLETVGQRPPDITISDDPSTPVAWAAVLSTRDIALLNRRGILESHRGSSALRPDERESVHRLEGVSAAALTPDRRYLIAMAPQDGKFAGHAWKLAGMELAGNLDAPQRAAAGMKPGVAAVRKDGKLLAATGGGKLAVWSLSDGHVVAEIDALGPVKTLRFLQKQYLLADGQLVDMRRQAAVWQYELGEGILPWDTVVGSPDEQVWLVLPPPTPAAFFAAAGIELPDASTRQKLDALAPDAVLPAGKSTITPAMLLEGRADSRP